jgi:hypothetical protein
MHARACVGGGVQSEPCGRLVRGIVPLVRSAHTQILWSQGRVVDPLIQESHHQELRCSHELRQRLNTHDGQIPVGLRHGFLGDEV